MEREPMTGETNALRAPTIVTAVQKKFPLAEFTPAEIRSKLSQLLRQQKSREYSLWEQPRQLGYPILTCLDLGEYRVHPSKNKRPKTYDHHVDFQTLEGLALAAERRSVCFASTVFAH
jgi:hypothetical protein